VLGEELVQEYAKEIIKTLVKYLDYEDETEIPNTVSAIFFINNMHNAFLIVNIYLAGEEDQLTFGYLHSNISVCPISLEYDKR